MDMKNIDTILMQNILHHGNIGIHVIDRLRKTQIYNKVMSDLEGLEIEQVLNKDILDIFPSLNENTSTLIKVMNTGKPIINSTQSYFNYRGHSITTLSTTLPLFSKGVIIGAMEIAQDVTSIRNLSYKLLELQGELNKSNDKRNTKKINKYSFHDIIGESKELVLAKKIGEKASKTSSGVLIYGETGTGKEMFAQSIHNDGDRAKRPFIAQNCAAIPETLLEGLLFGTDKGGFTGAIEREGIFEQTNGGTLLLDEINSMSLPLQAKLLRVLQEGYIRRVGGIKDIPIDVRIIATSNEDPKVSINNGNLRKDLFYRLSIININIPPLRNRGEDIELLIEYFIKKYNQILARNIVGVSNEVLDKFYNYNWPGNIRELENFIEAAMNMASARDRILNLEDFISSSFISSNNLSYIKSINDNSLPEILEDVEKNLINEILKKNNHNITKTAKDLGIKRQTLQHKLKKFE